MIKLKQTFNNIKQSSLAKDTFWAIFGNALGKGMSLVSAIWIAKILGKDAYGEYGFVINTMIAMAIFCTFGLGYTSTKFISENRKKNPSSVPIISKLAILISSILALIGTLVIFVFANYISISFLKQPNLNFLLKLSSVYIFFNTIVRTQIGILAGFNAFKKLAKINTITGVATLVISVMLAYYYGINGALIGSIFVQGINYAYNYFLIRDYTSSINIKTINKEAIFKELTKFSLPIALQEIAYSLLTWLFGLLLVKFSTFGEVGLNSAALYWNALILFIPGILRNVVLSHLSEANDNNIKHNKILKIILIFNFTVTLILCLGIYIFSDFIVDFYGDSFIGLKNVLNYSVFTTIFVSMSNVYAQAYMSAGKNWIMLAFRIVRDCTALVIGYYLLIKYRGINGALLLTQSTLIISVLFLIIMAYYYEKQIKTRKSL